MERKGERPLLQCLGHLEYHNAMVVGTEEADDGSPGVRVLLSLPHSVPEAPARSSWREVPLPGKLQVRLEFSGH